MTTIRDDRGFGLAEAIVSLVILGIMLAAMIPAFVGNIAFNTTSEARTGAVAVAQETLDNLRAVGEEWPASGAVVVDTTSLGIYQARITHGQLCDDDQCYDGARRVSVRVTQDGQQLFQVETVFTTLDPAGL